jgi:hypothetical protein
VGDVATMSGEVTWKVVLPKGITKGRHGGVAFLSEKVRSALEGHLASKLAGLPRSREQCYYEASTAIRDGGRFSGRWDSRGERGQRVREARGALPEHD